MELTDTARDGDDDIETGLNLMFPVNRPVLAYPNTRIEEDSTKDRLLSIVVADSYYWGPFNKGMSNYVFKNGKFWFYNHEIYPDMYEKPLYTNMLDIREEILKNDMVIILATDATLKKFGWGFIEQAHTAFFGR